VILFSVTLHELSFVTIFKHALTFTLKGFVCVCTVLTMTDDELFTNLQMNKDLLRRYHDDSGLVATVLPITDNDASSVQAPASDGDTDLTSE